MSRAKAELGNAIDRRINLDVEAMELALLAKATGLPSAEVRKRLDAATLEQLTEWKQRIDQMDMNAELSEAK